MVTVPVGLEMAPKHDQTGISTKPYVDASLLRYHAWVSVENSNLGDVA
jgi:hypothetical protein